MIMRICIHDGIIVMITSPKTIRVSTPIKINESPKRDFKFIISCNESLAEYTIKNKIGQLLFKYGYEYAHEHEKNN